MYMPERPVVHARPQEAGRVRGSLHRVEVQSRVQKAHGEGRLRGIGHGIGQCLLGRCTRHAGSNILVGRPRLIVVAAPADKGQRLAVFPIGREAGLFGRQHDGVRREREEVAAP